MNSEEPRNVGIPFEEKIKLLTEKLGKHIEEGAELEKRIKAKLKE